MHQATEFHPNRTACCENMTSFQFFKMADAAAQYYFQFPTCWCRCIRKVKIYQQTQFCRHISIRCWDITTSVLEKQTSAILEFYFRFRFRPFHRTLHIILHQATKFCPNGSTQCGIMTSYRFQDGGRQPCCICFGIMADNPRSAFRGLNVVLKSLVRRINSSRDIAMYRFWRFGLKLPIHVPFWEVFTSLFGESLRYIFPRWCHPLSWPPKGPSLGGNTSFEQFSARIMQQFELRAWRRKKTG